MNLYVCLPVRMTRIKHYNQDVFIAALTCVIYTERANWFSIFLWRIIIYVKSKPHKVHVILKKIEFHYFGDYHVPHIYVNISSFWQILFDRITWYFTFNFLFYQFYKLFVSDKYSHLRKSSLSYIIEVCRFFNHWTFRVLRPNIHIALICRRKIALRIITPMQGNFTKIKMREVAKNGKQEKLILGIVQIEFVSRNRNSLSHTFVCTSEMDVV